ncbi:LysE family transporter [Reichenbachiella agarivorans]|uniref:LysE family transporter n=1 Tax=Reichenbachiella agarivorans TaxID=2979464 RepID=A0ABY6CMT5_9BACT|nr:LysE family transporter [Reichenbachiella agarivorans]UXP31816.1 LysE family transporter [Reichenbachiella agarivorans]
MPPYLIGISTGLILVVSTGPVFLTLLQNSLNHGFQRTLFFIMGVAVADTGILFITWFGMSKVTGDEPNPYLALAGGILLSVFGMIFLLKDKPSEEVKIETSVRRNGLASAGLFGQGFMLGAINPIVWGFWAAMSNYAITTYGDPRSELFYFLGILNIVWVTDVLKAYYAGKLKKYLNVRVQKVLRKVIGVVLIVLGLNLIFGQYISF